MAYEEEFEAFWSTYPPGWTDFGRSATPLCQFKRRWRSYLSRGTWG